MKEKIKRLVSSVSDAPVPAKLVIKLTIEEVRSPETRAAIVAHLMAQDLEKRIPFRRVLKNTVEKVMANRATKGVKVALSGRLDGSEMARYEWLRRGRIPLQTLRADIDYVQHTAFLPYGAIGIKVWIYKGEVFGDAETDANKQTQS